MTTAWYSAIQKYERMYGERYSAGSPPCKCLEGALTELTTKYRLERAISRYAEQLTLF